MGVSRIATHMHPRLSDLLLGLHGAGCLRECVGGRVGVCVGVFVCGYLGKCKGGYE